MGRRNLQEAGKAPSVSGVNSPSDQYADDISFLKSRTIDLDERNYLAATRQPLVGRADVSLFLRTFYIDVIATFVFFAYYYLSASIVWPAQTGLVALRILAEIRSRGLYIICPAVPALHVNISNARDLAIAVCANSVALAVLVTAVRIVFVSGRAACTGKARSQTRYGAS